MLPRNMCRRPEEDLIGPRQQTVWHVAGFFEIARAPKPLHLAHLFRAIVVELDYFGNFRRPTIFRTKAKVIPQLECNVRPPPHLLFSVLLNFTTGGAQLNSRAALIMVEE